MRIRIVCLVAMLALCAFMVSAQTSRGTVSGIIVDPNGAVVGGATITKIPPLAEAHQAPPSLVGFF